MNVAAMLLTELDYRNIRNLELCFAPSPGINVLWGENGQGKTNILEGIYLFPHFKSFRGGHNEHLLGPDGERGRLRAVVRRGAIEQTLTCTIGRTGRQFQLDGRTPRPLESLLDTVRAVLFAPEELPLVRSQPAARRSLLDRALLQYDPTFLPLAVEYERILRQRNRLLREGQGGSVLQPWTDGLLRCGAQIRAARRGFLDAIGATFGGVHSRLSGAREEVTLLYPGVSGGEKDQFDHLAGELERVRGREERLGQTLAGPHRDDLLLTLDGKPLRHHASQGQLRTLLLSFKLALLELLRCRLGTAPVLLLDDMAAELDGLRQEALYATLRDCGAQIFLTTTTPEPLRRMALPAAYFEVAAGRIRSTT